MSHGLLQDYIVDMNLAVFFRPVGLHIISPNYLVFRIAYHLNMRIINILTTQGSCIWVRVITVDIIPHVDSHIS